jgi:Protein of unknown function (DUF3489)
MLANNFRSASPNVGLGLVRGQIGVRVKPEPVTMLKNASAKTASPRKINHPAPAKAGTKASRAPRASRSKSASPSKLALTAKPKRASVKRPTVTPAAIARPTKQNACLALLRRTDGATIEDLQTATGWLPHSVRGFLAGAVKKKLGLNLDSTRQPGSPRRYRVVANAGAQP